jgi:hypothetical protein
MSGDLRAVVEGLEPSGMDGALEWSPDGYAGYEECREVVLSLIPEGAVLVTEETLAAAIDVEDWEPFWIEGESDGEGGHVMTFDNHAFAAAILRHLRERTTDGISGYDYETEGYGGT